MKKTESLFIGVGVALALGAFGAVMWQRHIKSDVNVPVQSQPVSKYGAFLAAQHAIYVNDFDSAYNFSRNLADLDFSVVAGTRYMSEFLSGRMPNGAENLKDEKAIPSQMIYDAYLLQNDKWDDLYKRHKKDVGPFTAPFRIWTSVATGHQSDALAFLDKLPTNKSWKSFVRGQIFAASGDVAAAAEEFKSVDTNFLNINDYLYLMSFYQNHDMANAATALKNDFTSKPGGMYMLEYDAVPDWKMYDGYKNALAFSLVQNVSHTQIIMYSDLAILMLRFAQITGPEFGTDVNVINYYIGQYFYTNRGNWARHFDQIEPTSPFYVFAKLRGAENQGDIKEIEKIAKDNPLFVPAINNLVSYNIKNGDDRAALRHVNHALENKNLNTLGRAFFLKTRAHIHYIFGDFAAAQKDVHNAASILTADADIVSLQAKIWAAQNREIENAYEYAMRLVHKNPSDVFAWDTLGRVILVREGAPEALELIERVANVATYCSALFDLLGDLYVQTQQYQLARDAYMRAIDLSDDGLVAVPAIQKKLRNIK